MQKVYRFSSKRCRRYVLPRRTVPRPAWAGVTWTHHSQKFDVLFPQIRVNVFHLLELVVVGSGDLCEKRTMK